MSAAVPLLSSVKQEQESQEVRRLNQAHISHHLYLVLFMSCLMTQSGCKLQEKPKTNKK